MNKETKHEGSFLLRIFNLSFVVLSVLPILVIFYVFQTYDMQDVLIDKEQLRLLLIIVTVSVLFVFWGFRTMLLKIIGLSRDMKNALLKRVDTRLIRELAKEKGEIADLAKTFGDMLDKMEDNIRELEDTKRNLYDILTKIGKALSSMENLDLLLSLILDTTLNALGARRGVILVLLEDGTYQIKALAGMGNASNDEIMSALNQSLQWVISQKKILFTQGLEAQEKPGIMTAPSVCAPLICHDKVVGALFLGGKQKSAAFNDDEVAMINHLSSQVAMALENFMLNKDMETTYLETIAALALAVEAKDTYSRGHSERVGVYAVKIGTALGMPESDLQTLRDVARLHDIGKIGIADNVLKKAGKFTPEEREIMRKHPAIGEGIVKPLKNFKHLLSPIRHHHEMLDGTGYPDGLSGGEIPLVVRVLTVADIFDAITSNRVYREAMVMDSAKRELRDMVGNNKLDQKVVDALMRLVDEKKITVESMKTPAEGAR